MKGEMARVKKQSFIVRIARVQSSFERRLYNSLDIEYDPD